MCSEHRGQRVDEAGRVVQHRDSLELKLPTSRELFQFDIDIVERFHMVTEKADRRDQQL